MEAMFETVAEELRSGTPIESWRRSYPTTESRIVSVLEATVERHPGVLVCSYPSFDPVRQVEVVLKSSDPEQLAAAVAWIEPALDVATR
jgi:molybdopterin-biosynthesis enzyme MoeA-like protein